MSPLRLLVFGLFLAGTVPTAVNAQEVYFGNLHAHTSYSDGSGTPAEAFAMAKEAGLDFLAITEHNHDRGDGSGDRRDGVIIAARPALYSGDATSLTAAARAATSGTFVALYGQEYSTISSGNHINVFDVPAVIPVANGAVEELLEWLAVNLDSGGQVPIMQFNHPRDGTGEPHDYGRRRFASDADWLAALAPHVSLIEVLNAPALKDGRDFRTHRHEREYFGYLNLGFRIGPSVGHDNHYRNWGVASDARIGVIAPRLTKRDLLTALRARHVYASEDRNLEIIFRANGGLGGDVVPPPEPGAELDLEVRLFDPDEPAARYRVDVFLDEPGGAAARAPVESYRVEGSTDGFLKLDGVRFTAAGAYVLLRITQYSSSDDEHEREDDRAWTAPVWFDAPGSVGLAPSTLPHLRIAALLPDPAGDDATGETITLANTGEVSVDLVGWTLRDLAENVWLLDDQPPLLPGEVRTIQRNRQPLSLNNAGDTVELIAPSGMPAHSVTYGPVVVDEPVDIPPE